MTAHARADVHIMSCDAARPLAREVARRLGVELVKGCERWFACGEGKYVIEENIRGTDLYVFQNPICPGDARSVYDRFVMLLHAVEAAALSDAEWVTVVLPYYPGARQDKRKNRVREGIHAGLFARMLQEAGAHRVIAIDIHNEAIAGMFDPGRCRLENVQLNHRLARFLSNRGLAGDMVVSPDVGGMERARHYAAELSLGLAGLSKERDYSTVNRVLRSTLIGEVAGKDVLLVDDIVDTAGSVCAAVETLRDKGAGNITVACAHPILSGPAWDRLEAIAAVAASEGWRFTLVGSTSIVHPGAPDWFVPFEISGLLAEVIGHINNRGSVTGVIHADEPDC
jgi:ribose-phosphate pyrophosphokinase